MAVMGKALLNLEVKVAMQETAEALEVHLLAVKVALAAAVVVAVDMAVAVVAVVDILDILVEMVGERDK